LKKAVFDRIFDTLLPGFLSGQILPLMFYLGI
jgi:hypothetical protein